MAVVGGTGAGGAGGKPAAVGSNAPAIGFPPAPTAPPPASTGSTGSSASSASAGSSGSTGSAGSSGSTGSVSASVSFGPPPDLAGAAAAIFGDGLALAELYARWLGTEAVVRGLIGPRETDRLWERHLLNCAAVADLIPSGAFVVDIGSGAGLPGIVLAVARPDLTVILVEPLARRTSFLSEVVSELDLRHVTVMRARAEECVGLLTPADVVTARAVAPLDRLAAWCLPLARVGGRLVALKGATATDEVETHRDAVARLGGGAPTVRMCGGDLLSSPTTVVEVRRERVVGPSKGSRRTRRPKG